MLPTKVPEPSVKPEFPHSILLKFPEIEVFHCKSAEFELMLLALKLLGFKQVGHAFTP